MSCKCKSHYYLYGSAIKGPCYHHNSSIKLTFFDDKYLLEMFLSEIINSINWIMMVTLVVFNFLTIHIAM